MPRSPISTAPAGPPRRWRIQITLYAPGIPDLTGDGLWLEVPARIVYADEAPITYTAHFVTDDHQAVTQEVVGANTLAAVIRDRVTAGWVLTDVASTAYPDGNKVHAVAWDETTHDADTAEGAYHYGLGWADGMRLASHPTARYCRVTVHADDDPAGHGGYLVGSVVPIPQAAAAAAVR